MSGSMILLIVVGVALVALGARLLLPLWRRRRTPPQLRGDWWARFESEFRAYAELAAKADGKAGRRVRDRRAPPR
jgi:hypothetical protein